MKHATRSKVQPTDGESPAVHPFLSGDAAAKVVHAEGRFETHTWTDAHSYGAAAYVVVPKVRDGWRYTVHASGFDDSAYYGSALTLRFTTPEAQPWSVEQQLTTRVRERGEAFWVWLSSISGPLSAQAEAAPFFEARFAGMRVAVEIELDRNRTPD